MRQALLFAASIVLALAFSGCGGDTSPETRSLVLVTSESSAGFASIIEAFAARSGRSVELRAFDPKRGAPEHFDLLVLPHDAAPFASASPDLFGPLHAWPLARAGAAARHDEGLWVGVARHPSGLLAAGVSASSDIDADARELVAFLLSDEGQAALESVENLEAIVPQAR